MNEALPAILLALSMFGFASAAVYYSWQTA